MIENFKLISNKEEGKTVFDRLPFAVSWTFDNKQYFLESEEKMIATILKNRKEIAVVIAPFNIAKNKAMIINGNNDIHWDVSRILKVSKKMDSICFCDVYYVMEELNFFVNEKNRFDFRFSFDTILGEIGSFIQCK